MKKRLLISFITSIISVTLLAGCGQTSGNTSNNEDTIKIGSIGPLSGSASTYGLSVKEGAQLLEKEINSSGGVNGKQIKFIFEDDQAATDPAMQAFNKLVHDEKVCAILGPVTSGSTLAVAPNATSNKIPLITPTSTEPTITTVGGDYVFRGCFVDSFQGEGLAKYASDTLNKKTAAILYNASSDYSKGIADSFKKTFEENGGKVDEFLTYSSDKDTDFNAQLTKIKSSNPDILLLPDYYNVVGLIAKQARGMGIESQLLGGDGWESEDLAKIGGEAVSGAIYMNHYYSGDSNEQVKSFVENYKKEYNKEPDCFAALGYDSSKILVEAIKSAGSTDPEEIRSALLNIQLDSVTGNIKFNDERSAVKSAALIKIDKVEGTGDNAVASKSLSGKVNS